MHVGFGEKISEEEEERRKLKKYPVYQQMQGLLNF
jgi:hypothetical protein